MNKELNWRDPNEDSLNIFQKVRRWWYWSCGDVYEFLFYITVYVVGIVGATSLIMLTINFWSIK